MTTGIQRENFSFYQISTSFLIISANCLSFWLFLFYACNSIQKIRTQIAEKPICVCVCVCICVCVCVCVCVLKMYFKTIKTSSTSLLRPVASRWDGEPKPLFPTKIFQMVKILYKSSLNEQKNY